MDRAYTIPPGRIIVKQYIEKELLKSMAKLELLKGMKVIDMASFVAGPTCAKILAEYGAAG